MEEKQPHIPLPRTWPEVVQLAVVHVIGLAHASLTVARGWCADSPIRRVQLTAENDRLQSDAALLRKELEIHRGRQSRQPPARRLHYSPIERLQILQVKAARGWNHSQCARRFLVAPSTIADWQGRLDDKGSSDFFRPRVPVNRYADFVVGTVQELRAHFPTLGKKQIADLLARAALHLSVSTVGRMLERARPKRPPPRSATPPEQAPKAGTEAPRADTPQRAVTAREPNHLWHVDITVVPTLGGFWVPWWPFSLPTCWPFSWHVGVVLDHFSRRVLAIGVFRKEPASAEMCALLERAVERAGGTPKHIVSDKGQQFLGRDEDTQYQLWCKQRGIRMRFGAVEKRAPLPSSSASCSPSRLSTCDASSSP